MSEEIRRARSFELAPLSACEAILARDAAVLGEDAPFLAANRLSYYVGINTWLIQVNHWCGPVFQEVADACVRDGLRAIVMRFDSAANHLIAGDRISDDLVSDVLDSVMLYPRDIRYLPPDYLATPLCVKLQICRYLKRMNLINDTVLGRDALRDFVSRQLKIRDRWFERASWPTSQVNAVNAAAAELASLDWEPVLAVFKKAESPLAMEFTHGAAIETGRDFAKKLRHLAAIEPGFYRPIFGDYKVKFPDRVFNEDFVDGSIFSSSPIAGYTDMMRKHCVRMTTAPKAIKGPRLIAVEPLLFQMKTKWLQQQLYRILPEGIDLNDQTGNQLLAIQGSADGSYATIDLSAASDYVSKVLVSAVFPTEVAAKLAKYAPTEYRLYGLDLPLHSYATMGNGLTFWVETLVFWAVARAACHSVGCSDAVKVYGDDIVLPTQAYRCCCDLLAALGFSVNETKSFGSGSFRESCGVEAFGGSKIYSAYFPRMPLRGDITVHTCTVSPEVDYDTPLMSYFDSTSRLVALQHRLYCFCLPAARFVAAVVQDAHPGMTTTRWGDESAPDLWASESSGKLQPALIAKRVRVGWYDQARKVSSVPVPKLTYNGWMPEPVWKAPLLETDLTRETEYAPRITYKGAVDKDALALAELLRYWRFLERGPQPLYPDDTVDCVGLYHRDILTQPDKTADLLRTPVVKYGYRPR
jgi:hypothetical protein